PHPLLLSSPTRRSSDLGRCGHSSRSSLVYNAGRFFHASGPPMLDSLLTYSDSPYWLVLIVIVSTFMLEDLAIIGAALLAASGKIDRKSTRLNSSHVKIS